MSREETSALPILRLESVERCRVSVERRRVSREASPGEIVPKQGHVDARAVVIKRLLPCGVLHSDQKPKILIPVRQVDPVFQGRSVEHNDARRCGRRFVSWRALREPHKKWHGENPGYEPRYLSHVSR